MATAAETAADAEIAAAPAANFLFLKVGSLVEPIFLSLKAVQTNGSKLYTGGQAHRIDRDTFPEGGRHER